MKQKVHVFALEASSITPQTKQRTELAFQALQKIQERIPGTRDLLAEWTLVNTPIEIFATDEELRALEAQA